MLWTIGCGAATAVAPSGASGRAVPPGAVAVRAVRCEAPLLRANGDPEGVKATAEA